MVVFILEKAPPGLRGELTRWMLEPKAGVFVGRLSGMVRDRLWEKIRKEGKGAPSMMIWSHNNEQGYRIDTWGTGSRQVYDWEGLLLVSKP